MTLYRRREILLSDEVMFYLKLEAKRMVQNTDASITEDAVADGLIRNELTRNNPEWVERWAELEEAKEKAKKEYRAIEAKALETA